MTLLSLKLLKLIYPSLKVIHHMARNKFHAQSRKKQFLCTFWVVKTSLWRRTRSWKLNEEKKNFFPRKWKVCCRLNELEPPNRWTILHGVETLKTSFGAYVCSKEARRKIREENAVDARNSPKKNDHGNETRIYYMAHLRRTNRSSQLLFLVNSSFFYEQFIRLRSRSGISLEHIG